jgi:site-specific recombinase XerD
MQTVLLQPLLHRNTENIGIYFEKHAGLQQLVRRQPGAKWSQSHQCWYIPLGEQNYLALLETLKPVATVNVTALRAYLLKKQKMLQLSPAPQKPVVTKSIVKTKPVALTKTWELSDANLEALTLFVQRLQLKAYSPSTINTYRNEFIQLLKILKQKPVHSLTTDDLRRYMVFAMKEQHITENTAHSRLNALKFYFEQVLGREKFFWEIPRPKKAQKLPKVISEEKIIQGLLSVQNLKHRTLLLLAYSAGLRVSEVVSLMVTDVNSDRMQLSINGAKGKKDRVVNLSEAILPLLREYYKSYKPKSWLFEGQDKSKHYSTRSAQIVFNDAYKKLGLPSQCSFHSLRHSFATNLLEIGTDISYFQNLLGHSDIKTTLRYTQITTKDIGKIESPLDRILRNKAGK